MINGIEAGTRGSGGEAEGTDRIARKARAGDPAAFASLYARTVPAVLTYASLRLGSRWLDAEDVVAEVWCRTIPRIAEYDPSRPFRAWIFGFVRRVVTEAQRRMVRAAARGHARSGSADSSSLDRVPASISSASRKAARSETLTRFLAWAKESLSDYEREILLLRGLQGRPFSEVARALDRTERAVTVCWGRLLRRIKVRELPAGLLIPASEHEAGA